MREGAVSPEEEERGDAHLKEDRSEEALAKGQVEKRSSLKSSDLEVGNEE